MPSPPPRPPATARGPTRSLVWTWAGTSRGLATFSTNSSAPGSSKISAPSAPILDAAPAAYAPRADTLVHGDLYARHLLVDPAHQLAGVIDWGDVHLGDPAVDLMIVSTFLPPTGREPFFHVYGQIPEVTRQIAHLRGLWHTLTVVAYAHAIGDADLLREGQIGLRHLALG